MYEDEYHPYDAYGDDSYYEQDCYDEPDIDFGFECDSALASAGFGTDEDYGYYGNEDAAMESALFGDC